MIVQSPGNGKFYIMRLYRKRQELDLVGPYTSALPRQTKLDMASGVEKESQGDKDTKG